MNDRENLLLAELLNAVEAEAAVIRMLLKRIDTATLTDAEKNELIRVSELTYTTMRKAQGADDGSR